MKNVLKAIFDNVFWPAAAGNVFWSFCNIIIDPKPGAIGVSSRLVILLLFSIYLTISWLRVRVTQGSLTYFGWFFDFLHLWAIIFAALSTQIKPEWLGELLIAYFFVTALGHLSGQWKLPEDEKYLNLKLAAINFVGILAIFLGGYCELSEEITLPGSFLLVFSLWLFFGRGKEITGINEKLANREVR